MRYVIAGVCLLIALMLWPLSAIGFTHLWGYYGFIPYALLFVFWFIMMDKWFKGVTEGYNESNVGTLVPDDK